MKLAESAAGRGYRLISHDSLASTNDAALQALREGDPGRLWIVAARQTAGRGRGGRPWSSPPGNLYASLALLDPCAPALAPQLGFVAGIALHRAVAEAAPRAALRLALKWPNDLLLDGAKIAGILVEGAAMGPGRLGVAVGIGVNLAAHPDTTPYPATDLAAHGIDVSVASQFAALSGRLAEDLSAWSAGAEFASVRREWLARAGGLGQRIRVRQAHGQRHGIFVDVDAEGRLLLKEDAGILAVSAGDVFLERVDQM